MFVKLGEAIAIDRIENAASCIAAIDPEILENFRKFAANLKKIAPKAEDFLYFSAVMMHAAEASAINDDGSSKLTVRGEPVEVGWDQSGGTWRWVSNDSKIRPYKNSNADIFPESELVKAHKKWVGKPLCVDHKSSSVDHVRGFIVDTYYDRRLKRVVALCALDKAGYPQLARQLSTGVSNCVSMGTGVGKAICTECARVASAAADFCAHMKNKTGYGEINIDLNPIELSIVVNGADPKATIKHIIAAANTLNSYVDSKKQELDKIASKFQANLSFEQSKHLTDDQGGIITNVNVSSTDLDSFRKDVDKAIADFQKLRSSLSDQEMELKDTNSTNDLTSKQRQLQENTIADVPVADSGLAPPHARFASNNQISELQEVTQTIAIKLNHIQDSLNKLGKSSTKEQQEETTMSGVKSINKQGYFQGGGGVNEPTPGQAKYEKDPLNEQDRLHEDKQMVGQKPFPGVGDVDGLHPSPDSADVKNELERKKMLARAEMEERAMRRQAIVDLAKKTLEDKKAYFQNGQDKMNVNTPTPGQVKYPIDKLNEYDRLHEDKQMVGQKPFPGVGAVDGLHPSPVSADVPDEKKRKEMLQRASLRARFVKAANGDGTQNLGKSAWEVFLGDKLLLTASVDELSGGRADFLYDSIATKDFGVKLIERVKKEGADKVSSLIKKAQPAPAPEAVAAPMPEATPEAVPEAEDTGKSGDPKENVLELAEKVRDLSSDMVEGVRALTGEQAEMGEMEEKTAPAMGAAAGLQTMRKELNGALVNSLKEAVAELRNHQEELTMIADLYNTANASNQDFAVLVQDAVNEAKTAVADGFQLMAAFVKYAKGSQAIVKRAEMEAELTALAQESSTSMDSNKHDTGEEHDELMELIGETNADLDAVKDLMYHDEGEMPHLEDLKVDDNEATLEVKPGETVPHDVPSGVNVEVMKAASYDNKEGRAVLRAKLAADALGKQDNGEVIDMSKCKFNSLLEEANSLSSGDIGLDVKPTDDLGWVENSTEQNKAMMEVAKAPPKVRKEAEAIQRLVSEGKLDPTDLDALIAEGLDKDAVAYWKKYYGQVDGGSEFASELVKEHVKAQMEEEIKNYKVKIARSYELAYDMVERGLCLNERSAISTQVDEIMKFNDESFDSLKRVVARHAPLSMTKQANQIPQVGLIGSGDVQSQVSNDSLFSQFSVALSKDSKRMF